MVRLLFLSFCASSGAVIFREIRFDISIHVSFNISDVCIKQPYIIFSKYISGVSTQNPDYLAQIFEIPRSLGPGCGS